MNKKGFWQRLWARLIPAAILEAEVATQIQKALPPPNKRFMIDDARAKHLPTIRPIEPSGKGPSKYYGASFELLRTFYRHNPWLRAAVDIRKREIASADWDIIPNLDRHRDELDSLRRLVESVKKFPDRKPLLKKFNPQYLDRNIVSDVIEATDEEDLPSADIRYRFALVMEDLTRIAEEHATPIRKLFEQPNRNNKPWADILRAVIPDLLVLDQGCIELRRILRPQGPDGLPKPENRIVELHWVDGATVRPCIDEHGQLRGIESEGVAYEQWLDGVKQKDGGWRIEDLLYIQENPQTDVRMFGYGFSRVESLVMTSMLEAYADKEDLEEFKRAMFGGFLNVEDEAFQPEDVDSLREWIEEELEGTKKLPITAFNKLQWVSTAPHSVGRDKKAVEKLKRYVIRICATFEMPPVKLGIYESANYNTSQTSEEIADDGLRNLMELVDCAINRGIIATFGHNDVQYKTRPGHLRDDPEKLQILETRQKLGIDTPNDTRLEFGKEPAEWGEEPAEYFHNYFQTKGQAEGGGPPEEGEEESPKEGEEVPEGKEAPEVEKVKAALEKEMVEPEEEGEIEKALVLGFKEAIAKHKQRFGSLPHIEFEVDGE